MARRPEISCGDAPNTQWLERMYNNRARVPEYGDHFARWAGESALVRRSSLEDVFLRLTGRSLVD